MAGPLRFAAALPFLRQAFQASVPQTGKALAADVGMNVLMAGLAASSLPEGTSPGLRAGAFAEDLLTVPMSWVGRGLGYAGVRGASRLRGRPFSPENAAMAQGLAGSAAEMGLWMTGMVPRPAATAAINNYAQQMEQEQLQQQAIRDQQIRHQAIAQMGGAGLFMPSLQQSFGWGPYS